MIVGIGIDVCSIERMREALDRHGDSFWERICTAREKAEARGPDFAQALATRFAVKEAFAKATQGARGVGWHELELRHEPSGRPLLELQGKALELATSLGARTWHVSISHDAGIAAAVVILEGP